MRQAAICLALFLVLSACGKPTKRDDDIGPVQMVPVRPLPKSPPPVKAARQLGVKALTVKSMRKVAPAVLAAIEAELRSVLGQTRMYVLDAEAPDLTLSPRIEVLKIAEIGAGGAFTMRDLGLDPGEQFVEGEVKISGHLVGVGKPLTATVSKVLRAGKGTPGVSRKDIDGDGRYELHVTPEGVAALLRPALKEMVAQLVTRSHPGLEEKSAEDAARDAARKKALDAPPEK